MFIISENGGNMPYTTVHHQEKGAG